MYIGPDPVRLISIENGHVTQDINDGLRRLSKRTEEIEFEIVLKKATILSKLKIDVSQVKAFYFFFKENFIRFLQAPLTQLDSELFKDEDHPTVVILADGDLDYKGDFLYLVSETNIASSGLQFKRSDEDVALVKKYRDSVIEPPRWAGFQLQHITPLHFILKSQTGRDDDTISSLFEELLLHTAILYTANHASIHEKSRAQGKNIFFVATYASTEKTVKLRMVRNVSGSIPNKRQLDGLARWPFGGKDYDRLTIFQNVVARELQGETPQENYDLYAEGLDHLISDATWHYRTYLDGKINQHFGQVQELSKLISATASEVSNQLDAITKGLIEAMLAALGVIVGSLIAALVKNEIQNTVFQFGMLAYGIYT